MLLGQIYKRKQHPTLGFRFIFFVCLLAMCGRQDQIGSNQRSTTCFQFGQTVGCGTTNVHKPWVSIGIRHVFSIDNARPWNQSITVVVVVVVVVLWKCGAVELFFDGILDKMAIVKLRLRRRESWFPQQIWGRG